MLPFKRRNLKFNVHYKSFHIFLFVFIGKLVTHTDAYRRIHANTGQYMLLWVDFELFSIYNKHVFIIQVIEFNWTPLDSVV